jgi:acyl-CoA thioester hydrolase
VTGPVRGARATSEVELRVRYAETDRMGRAYYGAFLAWFEVGRVEVLRNMGATYAELEDEGVFLPVVEAHCRYLAGVPYDELVVVRTAAELAGPARLEFRSEVASKGTGKRYAEGRVVLACVVGRGRPMRLPGALREALEASPETTA